MPGLCLWGLTGLHGGPLGSHRPTEWRLPSLGKSTQLAAGLVAAPGSGFSHTNLPPTRPGTGSYPSVRCPYPGPRSHIAGLVQALGRCRGWCWGEDELGRPGGRGGGGQAPSLTQTHTTGASLAPAPAPRLSAPGCLLPSPRRTFLPLLPEFDHPGEEMQLGHKPLPCSSCPSLCLWPSQSWKASPYTPLCRDLAKVRSVPHPTPPPS